MPTKAPTISVFKLVKFRKNRYLYFPNSNFTNSLNLPFYQKVFDCVGVGIDGDQLFLDTLPNIVLVST